MERQKALKPSKLRSARQQRGLTLEMVCASVGVSKGQLSLIERGGGCSLAVAAKLVRFYKGKVSMEDIANTRKRRAA